MVKFMGKRVLVSGYIGFQNFGDDAIFGLLVKYLKRNNCNVTALSGDPRATQRMFKVTRFIIQIFCRFFGELLIQMFL